eukprot:2755386-Rhodomonas_salina.2
MSRNQPLGQLHTDSEVFPGSSRMREIQTTLTERALELLALPQENRRAVPSLPPLFLPILLPLPLQPSSHHALTARGAVQSGAGHRVRLRAQRRVHHRGWTLLDWVRAPPLLRGVRC